MSYARQSTTLHQGNPLNRPSHLNRLFWTRSNRTWPKLKSERYGEGKNEWLELMATNDSDRWTEDEEQRLRQLVLANTPPFEIAKTLGRTVSAVKARAHLLGITLARLGMKRRGLSRWG
jgi:hypothetical protein